jgi:mRNA interferase MazF
MNRGEVYWVEFGPGVGGEIQKLRPAIIVTSSRALPHLNRLQVVPTTSNVTRVFAGESLVTVGGRQSKALATQVTTVSKERVRNLIGSLSAGDIARVESALKVILDLR